MIVIVFRQNLHSAARDRDSKGKTALVEKRYHGHLSGVYCIALHPTLDILATGGRDAAVRVTESKRA